MNIPIRTNGEGHAWQRLDLLLRQLEQVEKEHSIGAILYLPCDPFLPGSLRCVATGSGCPEARAFLDLERQPLPPNGFEETCARGYLLQRDDAGEVLAVVKIDIAEGSCSQEEWQRLAPVLRQWFEPLLGDALALGQFLYESSQNCFPAFMKLLTTLDRKGACRLAPDRVSFLPVYLATERTGLDLNEVLAQILSPLEIRSPSWRATIHLIDDLRQELHPVAVAGEGTTSPPLRLKKGEGVASWVAAHRAPLLIHDLTTSKFLQLHAGEPEWVRGQFVVPLQSAKRLFGTLSLEASVGSGLRLQPLGYLIQAANLLAMALLQFEAEQTQMQREYYAGALNRELAKQVRIDDLHIPAENVWEQTFELPKAPPLS